jgi:Ca2+-binding EF-hand superfamily protein
MQKAMFSKADVNADGQLSQDEFSAIGQKTPEGGNKGSASQLTGSSSASFNFSSETLGALLSALQSDSSSTTRAAEMFSGADSDADGSLTAEELAADMASHAPPGTEGTDSTDMAAKMIAGGDSDGDGALSSDEFAAMTPPGGPPPGGPPPGGPPPSGGSTSSSTSEDSSTETTSYDAADTNQDGTVSMSELLASLQSASAVASGFSTEASDLMSKLLETLSAAGATSASASVSATA